MTEFADINKKQEELLYEKASKYCAYQPRCTKEIISKLLQLGSTIELAQKLIKKLKEEGFYNDELFAASYAVGKNRNNHWGKIRISLELRNKEIPQDIIKKALDSIDDDEYISILRILAEKKLNKIQGNNENIKFYKTMNYLAGKGYEKNIVYDILKDIIKSK